MGETILLHGGFRDMDLEPTEFLDDTRDSSPDVGASEFAVRVASRAFGVSLWATLHHEIPSIASWAMPRASAPHVL